MVAPAIREFNSGRPGMEGRFPGDAVFCGIIGQSQSMVHVFDRIREAGRTDGAVLIIGEPGTGKELIAQAVHQAGHRRHKPWVAVDLAALPQDRIEAELFGRLEPAAEGREDAPAERIGRFEAADGGTLYLEDIDVLEPGLQSKLLRALESRAIRPVGGDRECSVDVRVIAAVRRRPADMLRDGALREDLYDKLGSVTIELPPLRQRRSDIRLLVDAFLQEASRHTRRPAPLLDPQLMQFLEDHDWPENVRQLRDCLEGLIVAGGGRGNPLTVSDLPPSLRGGMHPRTAVLSDRGPSDRDGSSGNRGETHYETRQPDQPSERQPASETPRARQDDEPDGAPGEGVSKYVVEIRPGVKLRDLERMAIEQSLAYFHGNRKETANSLGISTRTLQRKLKQWRLAAKQDGAVEGE